MTLVIGLPTPMSDPMAGMEVSIIGPLELNSASNDQNPPTPTCRVATSAIETPARITKAVTPIVAIVAPMIRMLALDTQFPRPVT